MYLISRSSGLTLPLRDRKTFYTPQGDVLSVQRPLSVQFSLAGNVPAYAREAVSQLVNFGRGMGHNEDPFTRCGALDTEVEAERQGWSPEELEFVENALRNAASNGIEYVIAAEPRASKPWPKYDEIVGDQAGDQIAWQVDQLGLDVPSVVKYERENENRPEVVEALEALAARQAEDVVGTIQA